MYEVAILKARIIRMNSDKLNKRLTSLSNAKETSKVRDLYTLLFDDAIWYQAYQNIYSNRGAFTKGINSDTLDNFDKPRIDRIITSLRDGTYYPNPVKRVLIPKSNGKTRPLGIPTGTDKLVQEACRIVLESIYESKFSDSSHGFRPNRSCHTALKEIYKWTRTKWFIEFDIKGCFDNIDHDILISILKERIDSDGFLNLISKFLESGYMENWKYNKTFSGTPQGGIISPILANIYLDKLDKFIDSKCQIINSSLNERKITADYIKLQNILNRNRRLVIKYIDYVKEINEYVTQYINPIAKDDRRVFKIINECMDVKDDASLNANQKYNKIRSLSKYIQNKYQLNEADINWICNYKTYNKEIEIRNDIIKNTQRDMLNTKCYDTSSGLSRLHYVRYADDFICGFIGNLEQANDVYNDVVNYLNDELKLSISKEKSKIIFSTNNCRFLGYDIAFPKYTNERKYVQTLTTYAAKRRAIGKPVLKVPVSNAINFVKKNKYGDYVNNTSKHRAYLSNFDEVEIVRQYNAELRGFMNYYKYAINAKQIVDKVQWLSHYSLVKTIANKHKCSVSQVFKYGHLRIKSENNIKTWYVKVPTTDKIVEVFYIRDIKRENIFTITDNDRCNDNSDVRTINIRSSALKKLIAENCEVCGRSSDDVSIVLHHWNPIRNIPETDTFWNKVKKMRLRKTIAVCHECHMRIHHG